MGEPGVVKGGAGEEKGVGWGTAHATSCGVFGHRDIEVLIKALELVNTLSGYSFEAHQSMGLQQNE